MRNQLAILTALVLLTACSSSASDDSSTLPSSTLPSTTLPTEPTTTGPATSATAETSTTAPATTASATTVPTTTPCAVRGNTLPEESADPLMLSSLVGADIRVGDHACFERIVIELQGSGDFPGWAVGYVDDPVNLGESDETVNIEGSHSLLVRMGMWMQTIEGDGYDGPWQIFPTTVDHILELRMTENWEGMTIWAIGLDGEYAFTVDVLDGPPRLVIDVQVAED